MKYVAGAALLPSGVVKGSTTSYDNRKLVALKANWLRTKKSDKIHSPDVNSDLFPFGAPLWPSMKLQQFDAIFYKHSRD